MARSERNLQIHYNTSQCRTCRWNGGSYVSEEYLHKSDNDLTRFKWCACAASDQIMGWAKGQAYRSKCTAEHSREGGSDSYPFFSCMLSWNWLANGTYTLEFLDATMQSHTWHRFLLGVCRSIRQRTQLQSYWVKAKMTTSSSMLSVLSLQGQDRYLT